MSLSETTLIIFDLDGTLIEVEPTFRCFQKALTPALGRVPSQREILDRFGPPDHRIILDWVGPVEAPRTVERLYACYETAFKDADPFPGMLDLVKKLRERGKKTAIFTGRGREGAKPIIRSMRLDLFFEVILCGDEVGRSKPAPDGLLRIMELLHARPEESVYIGDTRKDYEAARAAGMSFLAALWGSPERETLADLPTVETVGRLQAHLIP